MHLNWSSLYGCLLLRLLHLSLEQNLFWLFLLPTSRTMGQICSFSSSSLICFLWFLHSWKVLLNDCIWSVFSSYPIVCWAVWSGTPSILRRGTTFRPFFVMRKPTLKRTIVWWVLYWDVCGVFGSKVIKQHGSLSNQRLRDVNIWSESGFYWKIHVSGVTNGLRRILHDCVYSLFVLSQTRGSFACAKTVFVKKHGNRTLDSLLHRERRLWRRNPVLLQ